MRITNTFILGKLNRDIDERLLEKGQYPDAYNIRVGNTDGSDVGAVETVRGNKLIHDLGLTNATCINATKDDATNTIYWFVTSDEKDLIMEYVDLWGSETITTVLEATAGGVLNFSPTALITGVNKIINGDSDKNLLAWVNGDQNPPRIINILRAKGYGLDGFIEEDISVIKKPPTYAPSPTLQTSSTLENFLDDRFVNFAYRYKYLDGEFSALSSFTPYQFFPKPFKLDYQTAENLGMENAFNQVSLDFNTGSVRVTDVQLIFRDSKSSNTFVIETFNKSDEGWLSDVTRTFVFDNSKKYASLPEDELNRTFDNVPKNAFAQEFIGNRLGYGNYREGYNMLDIGLAPVVVNYTLDLISDDIIYTQVGYTLGSKFATTDLILIDFSSIPLLEGSVINFNVTLTRTGASFIYNYSYILQEDFASASLLRVDADFIYFVETVMSDIFSQNVVDQLPTEPPAVTDTTYTGFSINNTAGSDILDIVAPFITYEIDSGGSPDVIHYWDYTDVATDISIGDGNSSRSLKTLRSYETGIVYMEEYARSSTVLTNVGNTLFVPMKFSTSSNKIQVTIENNPPAWADRYKFVVKQNKGDHETIYVATFYEDGLYRWIRLEGANVNKVQEGDTLIVKSDLSGALTVPVKLKVLEKSLKTADFIEGNVDIGGQDIIEEAGLYIRVKPVGFKMDSSDAETEQYYDSDRSAAAVGNAFIEFGNKNTHLNPSHDSLWGYLSDDPNTGDYTDTAITIGTRINFEIKIEEMPRGGGGLITEYIKSFTAQQNYDNFQDWYEAEVVTLGVDFEAQLQQNVGRFRRDANNNLTMQLQTSGNHTPKMTGTLNVTASAGDLIFETEADDIEDEVFYETGLTFDIVGNVHKGNIQDQIIVGQTSGVLIVDKIYRIDVYVAGDDFTNVGGVNVLGTTFKATGTTPTTWTNSSSLTAKAICLLDAFNCYVQGNGAESFKYRDDFNTNALRMNLRPNQVDPNGYKEVHRYADITYSEPYNDNSSLNGLNEFNLSRGNYKDDIEKSFGSIQKLYSRDTDLVVFQEDKVSYILFGKDLLFNADGTSNLTQIDKVLGRQVTYAGEYGISTAPESFAYDANTLYWVDSKRGAALKLGGNGIFEISNTGLRTWFKDKFRVTNNIKKLGAFDPYYDQYVLSFGDKNSSDKDLTLTYDEKPRGWTSFHSFIPDYMIGMNNSFFSFDNGNLYRHHDSEIGSTNKYYGQTFDSEVSVMVNDHPSDVKELRALSLEGSTPWRANVKAFITNTDDYTEFNIKHSEFVEKEGLWYAYARRSEDDNQVNSKALYGIGRVVSVLNNVITYNGDSVLLTSKDRLFVSVNGIPTLVGTIDIVTDTTITLVESAPVLIPATDAYILGRKNARIEGSNLRGYTFKVDLSLTPTNKEELFAINLEVTKSFR